jgi:hypothetical protein
LIVKRGTGREACPAAVLEEQGEDMDLKVFYQKMRKLESEIPEAHVIVVSLETPDGGKAGRRTEVNRETAARSVVEGRARLADAQESEEFRKTLRPAPREIETKALDEAVLRAMKETFRGLQQ